MKKQEIVERLENIVTEVMPDDENWRDQSVKDLVLKYKVRVTNNSAWKVKRVIIFVHFSSFEGKKSRAIFLEGVATIFSQHGLQHEPFHSKQWAKHTFSFQNQYSIEHTSDENINKC